MNPVDPWGNIRWQDVLVYPYDQVVDLVEDYPDPYRRLLPWLLASLAKFGDLCADGQVVLRNDPRGTGLLNRLPLAFISRLCSGNLLPADFRYYSDFIVRGNTDKCSAFPAATLLVDSVDELRTNVNGAASCDEVIFYQEIPGNKWAIYFLSIHRDGELRHVHIDGYFIGGVLWTDVAAFIQRLRFFVHTMFLATAVCEFRRRLHFPPAMGTDYVYLAILIIYYLQRHGNYLDLSEDTINHHKFPTTILQQFLVYHDRWLGLFKLDSVTPSSYPFICRRKTQVLVFDRLGWCCLDVDGDGHCGFYAMMLGLWNLGIDRFWIDTSSHLAVKMYRSDAWKKVLFDFRIALKQHSVYMLSNIYPRESRDLSELMWALVAVTDNVQVDGGGAEPGLSECLAPTGFDINDYFGVRFEESDEAHMNPYWASHVMASMFKIRVIVYQMSPASLCDAVADNTKRGQNRRKKKRRKKDKGSTYIWSVISFEYKRDVHVSAEEPHIEIRRDMDLYTTADMERVRVSDVEFNRVPTIEVFYEFRGENVPGHFQFLRRVICSGVPIPPQPDTTTLRRMLETQTGVVRWKVPISAEGDIFDCDGVYVSPPHEMADDIVPLDQQTNKRDVSLGPANHRESAVSAVGDDGGEVFHSFSARDHQSCVGYEGRSSTASTRKKVVHSPVIAKTSSKKKNLQKARLTQMFNKMVEGGELPATRLKFDTSTNSYYKYNLADHRDKSQPIRSMFVLEEELSRLNARLIRSAADQPDEWVGPTIEDAMVNTGDAPLELCTKVACIYQQHNNPYCIGYSFASALFYCGFKDGAEWMYNAAPGLSELDYDNQIRQLLSLAKTVVPLIGGARYYGRRTNRHDHCKRRMDWLTLFTVRTPYPTVVIPLLPDGRCTHAFCVVDDLIFDSTNPCALQLRMESVHWLFQGREAVVHEVYRFMQKVSPSKRNKVKGVYERSMKSNWTPK